MTTELTNRITHGEYFTSKEFKPCPFCGETTIYCKEGKDGGINCPSCLVRMPNECEDTEELIAAWNHRELSSEYSVDKEK